MRGGEVVWEVSEPDYDAVGARVDVAHEGDLLAAFSEVVLVDADGVDPEGT